MSTHHWLQRRVPRVQIHDEEIGQLRGQDKIVSPSFGMEIHIVQVDRAFVISTMVVSENLPMVDESTNVAATVSTSSFGCLVENVTCQVQIKLI